MAYVVGLPQPLHQRRSVYVLRFLGTADFEDLNFTANTYALGAGVVPETSTISFELVYLLTGMIDLNFTSGLYNLQAGVTIQPSEPVYTLSYLASAHIDLNFSTGVYEVDGT